MRGQNMYVICKKLKDLKRPLKQMHRPQLSNLTARVKQVEGQYYQTLQELQANPHNMQLRAKVEEDRNRARHLSMYNDNFFIYFEF